MAIERTQAVVRCDQCEELIEGSDEMVCAGTYGAYLHKKCLDKMSAFAVLVVLSLDDITIGRRNSFDAETSWWKDGASAPKLIYTKE